MRTELPKAQRGLDSSQQGHHIQVLDPAPEGGHGDKYIQECCSEHHTQRVDEEGREPGGQEHLLVSNLV